MAMFSEEYERFRRAEHVEDRPSPVPEDVLQSVWYDQLFSDDNLQTDDGRPLRVLSAGWWNRAEGPDFRDAQIELGPHALTGDVEVHVHHGAWHEHHHQHDERYDNVVLEVVLECEPPTQPPVTSGGKRVPCLLLRNYLTSEVERLAEDLLTDDGALTAELGPGHCAAMAEAYGVDHAKRLLMLAGEWRVLARARRLRERIDHVGPAQAAYEAFLEACGFSRFKEHFVAVARAIPYDRVRQLAHRDPRLVEVALLHVAGLLPADLPEGTDAVPHLGRLRALRRDELGGLRSLPLTWKRTGVRPNNYPERRLAGAALFLSRTAADGLLETLEDIWRADRKPVQRRRAFEALFPAPMGFWATHCSWTGRPMQRPAAPLGSGRVRTIIGNVFVPFELALARQRRNRRAEERVFEFFAALPGESGNRVLKQMMPRFFGDLPAPRLDFRMQQGMMQLYRDWCRRNPSCRDCTIIPFMDVGYGPAPERNR